MAFDIKQIEAGENLNTEFKREYTDEVKKAIIAFANTAGGKLYIGVNDDKSIKGVDKPDDVLLQIANTMRSSIKPDITMFVDYRAEKTGKAVVVIVTVQKGLKIPMGFNTKKLYP